MDGTRINVTFPTEMGLLTNLCKRLSAAILVIKLRGYILNKALAYWRDLFIDRLRVHTLGSHSGSIPTEIGNLSALGQCNSYI